MREIVIMNKFCFVIVFMLAIEMKQMSIGYCPDVNGLDSPINILNTFIDDFFDVYDGRSKGYEIQTQQITHNADKTEYKMLFQVVDKNESVVKHYIAVSSTVKLVDGKKKHVIKKFIQSDDIREVMSTVGISFKNLGNFNCEQPKRDFLTYYLRNTTVIEYFVHYFDIDSVRIKEVEVTEEGNLGVPDSTVDALKEQLMLLDIEKREEINSLHKKFELIVTEKESVIDTLEEELEDVKIDSEEFKTEAAALKENLEMVKEINKEKLIKQQEDARRKLDEQKEKYEDKIDSLDRIMKKELDLLAEKNKEELERMKGIREALVVEIDKIKEELELNWIEKDKYLETVQKLKDKEAALKDLDKEYELKLSNLKNEQNKLIKKLKAEKEKEIKQIEEGFRLKIKEIEEKARDERNKLIQESEKQIKVLKLQFEEIQIQNEKETQALLELRKSENDALIAKYKEDLRLLEKEKENTLSEDTKQQEIEELTKQKNEEIAEIRKETDLIIKHLIQKNAIKMKKNKLEYEKMMKSVNSIYREQFRIFNENKNKEISELKMSYMKQLEKLRTQLKLTLIKLEEQENSIEDADIEIESESKPGLDLENDVVPAEVPELDISENTGETRPTEDLHKLLQLDNVPKTMDNVKLYLPKNPNKIENKLTDKSVKEVEQEIEQTETKQVNELIGEALTN